MVGNPVGDAVLEATFGSIALRFGRDTRVAVTGAQAPTSIADIPVPTWTTLLVPAGEMLQIGYPTVGEHVYVAVAGGIDVPMVLASRSTHLGNNFGGFHGRALTDGDMLPIGSLDAQPQRPPGGTTAPAEFDIAYVESAEPIRAIRGAQYDRFGEDDCSTFWGATYKVSEVHDRQGERLEGPPIRAVDGAHDIISEPAYLGAVQAPSNGQPIVLLAARQPTGGYAKIASVVSADMPRLAQQTSGAEIRFQETTIETAQELLRQRHHATHAAELTPPSSVVRRSITTGGSAYDIAVAPSGASADGAQLWWTTVDAGDDAPAIVRPS